MHSAHVSNSVQGFFSFYLTILSIFETVYMYAGIPSGKAAAFFNLHVRPSSSSLDILFTHALLGKIAYGGQKTAVTV